jgi:hypothetical protein
MARRTFFVVLGLILVAMVAVGITACGSSPAGTTTTKATIATTVSSTTSSAAGAATTAGVSTTADVVTTADVSTTAGVSTTADTATQDEYKTQMSAWVTGPLQELDTSVFDIPDPANATTAQIDAVAAFVSKAATVLDQLKAIRPSAEAAVPHNQFVKAYEDLLTVTDKYVSALRSKDASELPAIMQAMSTSQGQVQQLVGILAPMIGLGPPTT